MDESFKIASSKFASSIIIEQLFTDELNLNNKTMDLYYEKNFIL